MIEVRLTGGSVTAASFVLGRKLDSIPFSAYHLLIITVLALVGFIEGYDLVITGSLLVLAKGPLHLTGSDIRWLAVGPTFMLCVGGFAASAVSDHWSRKSVMLIGVIATTLLTLLIPLVQNAEQLITVRLLTGLGAGGAVSAAFPIAAELMPAQHRRTYSAIYEMALAGAFTVVPFIAYLLADNPDAFRLLALPGGLAVTVVPVLVYLVLPESPRWHLRKGQPQVAVDIVNRIIERSGARVPPLTVEALGDHQETAQEQLPPYWALFRRGQLRWTDGWHSERGLLRHRLFSDFSSPAKGAGRPRCGRFRGLRTEFAGIPREYPGEGLYRLPDGDHRAAVDDRLRARRIAPWAPSDADGALGGRLRDGCDGRRCTDHRLYRTVRFTVCHLSVAVP